MIKQYSAAELTPFIQANVAPASTITTDGWSGLANMSYSHHQVLQTKTDDKDSVLLGVHLVTSLIKRLILGTFQGRFEKKYLQRYLEEYVFRFNRRTTKYVGKRFWCIVQQAVASKPITNKQIAATMIKPCLSG